MLWHLRDSWGLRNTVLRCYRPCGPSALWSDAPGACNTVRGRRHPLLGDGLGTASGTRISAWDADLFMGCGSLYKYYLLVDRMAVVHGSGVVGPSLESSWNYAGSARH